MKKPVKTKKYLVHSLERGLELMELLAKHSEEITLSELSRDAGFSQSTAHRILTALKARGYVQQNPKNSKYKLSLKLFELGSMIGRHLDLRKEARPLLQQLSTETLESAYLLIRDNDMALCVERIDGNPSIRILTLEVGGRQPLHLGAAPKLLLAHMDEEEVDRIIKAKGLEAWTALTTTNPIKLKHELKTIREQGYAISFNDVTDGVAAVAGPVFDFRGKVVASLAIAGMATNFGEERLPEIIKLVKSTAREFSISLGSKI